jgi:hypothetical protein
MAEARQAKPINRKPKQVTPLSTEGMAFSIFAEKKSWELFTFLLRRKLRWSRCHRRGIIRNWNNTRFNLSLV